MQEPQTPDMEQSTTRISLWKFLIGIAVVCMSVLAAFWFLPKPSTTEKPVRYSRNDDGSFTAEGDAPSGETMAFSAAGLEARNNVNTSSTAMNSGADFLPSNSIVVINQSDELLMKRAADRLVEVLKEKGGFDAVTHLPAGHWPEAGQRKPDLYAIIDLASMSKSGFASQDLNANVLVQFGPSIVDSNHSYSSTLDPPIFEFGTRMELNHTSTMRGVESSGSRGSVQGKNIGDALADHLLEEVEQRRDEEMPMPELPEGFYPAYEPVTKLKFLSQFDPEERLSCSGCCIKNETFWFIRNVLPQDLMTAVHAELSEAGWRGKPQSETRFFRMTKGPESVEIYVDRSAYELEYSEPVPFWIRYRKVLSRDERHGLYETMLSADPPDVDLLVALRRLGDVDQRGRLLGLVEENPARTFDAWFELAKRYFERADREKAIAAIGCAKLLQTIGQSDGSGKIHSLLKKQQVDQGLVKTTTATLDAIGIQCLDPDKETETIEMSLLVGKPCAIAIDKEDGDFEIIGVKLDEPRRGTNAEFKSTLFRLSNGASSWTSSVVHKDQQWQQERRNGGSRIVFTIDKDDRSKLVIEKKPAN